MNFDLLSPAVIATASATLAVTTAWRWVVDWRHARVLGLQLWEYRHGEQRRRWITSRVRARARGESSSGVQAAPGNDRDAYLGQTAVHVVESPRLAPEVLPGPTAPDPVEITNKSEKLAESSTPSPVLATSDNVRVFMLPRDQISEFLAFELAHAADGNLKRAFADWVFAYRRWAAIHAIGTMPESIFLNLLGHAPGVRKTRERRKDRHTGRVIKNAAGTPIRDYFYALGDDEEAVSKKPRGKRETKAERMAREASELAERRRLADLMPQQTWAEYLAAMTEHDRTELDLQYPRRKVA